MKWSNGLVFVGLALGLPSSAHAETPLEIQVTESAPEPGEATLARREVAKMPGAFGDSLRSIDSMPGVVPLLSGIPYFYIRGAPPSANGYTIDGVTIPLLFHIGAGPSVVAPGLVDTVSFHPSVAPVSLGRFAGGFIAAHTRAPSVESHLEGTLRPFDVSVLAETRVGDTDALMAGRYGNPNPILGVVGSNVRLEYGDYQVRVGRRLGDADRISVFAFGASDHLSDESGTILSARFHRVDMRWEHALPHAGQFLAAVTLASDFTESFDRASSNVDSLVTMRGVGMRALLDQPIDASMRLRAGLDAWLQDISTGATIWGTNTVDSRHRAAPMGAFADVVFEPVAGFTIVPGIRVDRYFATADRTTETRGTYYSNDKAYPAVDRIGVDPRLRSRIELARGISWTSSFGVAHQGPEYAAPVPGVTLSSASTRLQESFQIAQGLDVALPEKIALSLTGFRSVTRHVRDLIVACSEDPWSTPVDPSIPNRSLSQLKDNCQSGDQGDLLTHGIELLVRRDLSKRIGGMLAYTLSRSVRGDGTPARYDRTHVLNAILSAKLGRGFQFGARYALQSGRPVRDVPGISRLPTFHRVDLRLEKEIRVGDGRIAIVAEVLNVFLGREPTGYDCDAGPCTLHEIGPITIPSLGIEGSI